MDLRLQSKLREWERSKDFFLQVDILKELLRSDQVDKTNLAVCAYLGHPAAREVMSERVRNDRFIWISRVLPSREILERMLNLNHFRKTFLQEACGYAVRYIANTDNDEMAKEVALMIEGKTPIRLIPLPDFPADYDTFNIRQRAQFFRLRTKMTALNPVQVYNRNNKRTLVIPYKKFIRTLLLMWPEKDIEKAIQNGFYNNYLGELA